MVVRTPTQPTDETADPTVVYVGTEIDPEALTTALRAAGLSNATVEQAATPAAATSLLEAATIDCLVTEYAFGESDDESAPPAPTPETVPDDVTSVDDGVAFARACRILYPSVPVVLCPRQSTAEIAHAAVTVGIDEYVPQANGLDAIADAVTTAVAQATADGDGTAWPTEAGTAHTALVTIDAASGVIKDVTAAVEDFTGRSRDELRGKPHEHLYPEETRDVYQQQFERAAAAVLPADGPQTALMDPGLDSVSSPGPGSGSGSASDSGAAPAQTPPEIGEESPVESRTITLSIAHRDGGQIPVNVVISSAGVGDTTVIHCWWRVVDRTEFEELVTDLHTVTRTLMHAETVETLVTESVRVIPKLLRFDAAALYLAPPQQSPISMPNLPGVDAPVAATDDEQEPVVTASGDGLQDWLQTWGTAHRQAAAPAQTGRETHSPDPTAAADTTTVLRCAAVAGDAAVLDVSVPPAAMGVSTDRESVWPPESPAVPAAGVFPVEVPVGVGAVGDTFAAQEQRVYPSLLADEWQVAGGVPAEVVCVPLGGYGTLVCLTGDQTRVWPLQQQLVGILAANLQAALVNAEREAVLRQREQALAETNAQLDEFAKLVSHDLRNPLDVANGATDRLSASVDRLVRAVQTLDAADGERGMVEQDQSSDADSDGDTDSDSVEAALGEVGTAAETIDASAGMVADALTRMEAIISDMRTLVEETGDMAADREPVVVRDAVDAAWQGVKTPPEASVTVEVPGDVVVSAVPSQFQTLLENLFRNAVEHAGPAVTVTVSPVVASDGETVCGLTVADDGPGFSTAVEPQDLFACGYTTADEGTGFGLYIVETVVAAHGWEITAQNRSSGGAEFRIEWDA